MVFWLTKNLYDITPATGIKMNSCLFILHFYIEKNEVAKLAVFPQLQAQVYK